MTLKPRATASGAVTDNRAVAYFRIRWPAVVNSVVILAVILIGASWLNHRANIGDARYQKERQAWCSLTANAPPNSQAHAVAVVRTAYHCPTPRKP
jgi:hypothetical protein